MTERRIEADGPKVSAGVERRIDEVRAGPRRAAIAGWGMAVPEGKLTNSDLEARDIGTTNQWILERTGISERRRCAPDETTAGLAIAAGNAAIKSAGITPGDLSMVIVATCTPEQPIPEKHATLSGSRLSCARAIWTAVRMPKSPQLWRVDVVVTYEWTSSTSRLWTIPSYSTTSFRRTGAYR